MLFPEHLVLIRGGGDLGTGVAWRLHRAGFPVLVTELTEPLTIRRAVAVSTAVTEGDWTVEGMRAVRCGDVASARAAADAGSIAVLVESGLPDADASAVVDARMAKVNLDTTIDDADMVVALGPGFTVGVDCHAVVETQRGHHLGRVLWKGSAAPDSGAPGAVAGRSGERVVRSPRDGIVRWSVEIGDVVPAGARLGTVAGSELRAPFDGVVRGLLAEGGRATDGLKIADVDPRGIRDAAFEISDKALAVGGGVLEAMVTWLNRS